MFSGRYTYARPFARFGNLVAFVICFALDLRTRRDESAKKSGVKPPCALVPAFVVAT